MRNIRKVMATVMVIAGPHPRRRFRINGNRLCNNSSRTGKSCKGRRCNGRSRSAAYKPHPRQPQWWFSRKPCSVRVKTCSAMRRVRSRH
jgi:hypothetical protein